MVQNWARSTIQVFNLFAEYIIQNARLDGSQTGMKIPGEISTTLDM